MKKISRSICEVFFSTVKWVEKSMIKWHDSRFQCSAAVTWDNSKKVQKMEATILFASNATHFFWEKKLIQINWRILQNNNLFCRKTDYCSQKKWVAFEANRIETFAPFFIFKSLWNLSATRDLIWIFLPLCRKKIILFQKSSSNCQPLNDYMGKRNDWILWNLNHLWEGLEKKYFPDLDIPLWFPLYFRHVSQ